jgi:hypothetical protein
MKFQLLVSALHTACIHASRSTLKDASHQASMGAAGVKRYMNEEF